METVIDPIGGFGVSGVFCHGFLPTLAQQNTVPMTAFLTSESTFQGRHQGRPDREVRCPARLQRSVNCGEQITADPVPSTHFFPMSELLTGKCGEEARRGDSFGVQDCFPLRRVAEGALNTTKYRKARTVLTGKCGQIQPAQEKNRMPRHR